MSAFFEDLFQSIFIPGATPTLVVAANASFGALQVVLLGLLVATYSIHFLILSVLCGGLWFSINWFVRELQASKEEELASEKKSGGGKEGRERDGLRQGADDSGTETEADVLSTSSRNQKGVQANLDKDVQSMASSASSLKPESGDKQARHRKSSGNFSGTDSEWDKMESEAEA